MRKILEYFVAGAVGLAGIAGGCVPSKIPQAQTQREIPRLPLETRLFELMEAEDFDLAEAAFIASGVRDEAELKDYLGKFEKIIIGISSTRRIRVSEDGKTKVYFSTEDEDDETKAYYIYEALKRCPKWEDEKKPMPSRYKENEVRLTNVVDNQLKETVPVGNCMGLTLLMDAVCQRFGIELKSIRPYNHVYSAMEHKGKIIEIENTVPGGGFDFKRNPEESPVTKKDLVGNKQLIIYLLRNLGTQSLPKQREKAMSYFMASARLDPDETDLFYLTDTARREYGRDKETELMEDLHQRFPDSLRVKQYLSFALEQSNPKKALELYKDVYPTLYKRDAFDTYKMGVMHIAAGEYSEAMPFLEEALKMDPNNSLYIRRIVEVKKKLEK